MLIMENSLTTEPLLLHICLSLTRRLTTQILVLSVDVFVGLPSPLADSSQPLAGSALYPGTTVRHGELPLYFINTSSVNLG